MKIRQSTVFKYLLVGLLFFFAIFLLGHRDRFRSSFDPKLATERYAESSYGRTKAEYILSDEELYATEGYFLIAQNKDLHSLNPGHPPLGKYLIGLSIILFGNPYFFAPLFGLISLILLYRILRLYLPALISLLFTTIFSLEPLFLEQLTTSLLDIYLLTFSLASIYLYLLWLKKPNLKLILLSQFFLGLTLATKFYLSSFPLAAALLLTTVLSGDFKRFTAHILALPLAFAGFALGHFNYFFYHSPLDFLKYQRYVLSWWAGSPQVPPFQVFDLIFFNRWHTWWAKKDIISTNLWWIGWPVLLTLSLLSLLKLIRHHFPLSQLFFTLWFLFSFSLFSFEAVYPRHLFAILPALYFLASSLVQNKHGPAILSK